MSISPKSSKPVDGLRAGIADRSAMAAVMPNVRPPQTRPIPMDVKPVSGTAGGQGRGSVAPTIEDIRKRAYDLYLARRVSGAPGCAESDWLQAESDLRAAV